MDKTKKINNVPIVILLILMYIVVAMSDNFKGIFVPFFKSEFGVNNTEIGYVMTASLFAYAVFQFAGGYLIEKIGYKKTIMSGFLIGILSLLLLSNCKSFPMLVAGMFLLNMGMAMFNIGVNTLGPVLTVSSTVVLMNMIIFAYGSGNTLLQRISGSLLDQGIEWKQFYTFMLISVVALLVYLILIRIPYEPVVKETKGNYKAILKNKMLWFYILAMGFYLASEYGVGNWFVNYMSESFQFSAERCSFYIALFVGTKALGQLICGFVADRLGYFKTILTYSIITSIIMVVSVAMQDRGLLLFSIGGFFYSAIFPTLITTLGDVFQENTSYATGIILMCGTLIAMAVSMVIGILNDVIGSQYGIYMIPISMILCMVFSKVIHSAEGKKVKSESMD